MHIGDPSLNVTAEKLAVRRVELKSGRRNQLALGLIDIVFDPEVLSSSTVHGARDGSKQALDPWMLEAIRGKLCSLSLHA